MLQVSTIQACFVQASFTQVNASQADSQSPASTFADFFSRLTQPDSGISKPGCCGTGSPATSVKAAEPQGSTISEAIQSITQSLASLIHFVENRLDQLREQVKASLPDNVDLKQSSAVSRIEISGVFGKQKQLEDTLNNDMLFCESFKSVRIRYAEMQSFTLNPADENEAFSITLKDGKAALNPKGLNEDLFNRLMEELDRIRDKEKEKEGAAPIDPKQLV